MGFRLAKSAKLPSESMAKSLPQPGATKPTDHLLSIH